MLLNLSVPVEVEPRTCRQFDDAPKKTLVETRSGEATASIVEDFDEIRVANLPFACIFRVDIDGFSARDLPFSTVRACIKLAVQSPHRLV